MANGILTVISWFIIGWATAVAQQRIGGQVLDAQTGDPIAGATIFINGTTYGTSTSDRGRFELRGMPAGTYEVVISSLGYRTFATAIEISPEGSQPLWIKLEPQSDMLEEVEVVAFEKDGWKRWGRLFLDTFIGTSPNADGTKLINPDVLRFRYVQRDGYLEVVATAPLEIENRSLGYEVSYLLEDFRIDFRNRINRYTGYPHFREIPAGKRKRMKYHKRRAQTYQMSKTNFMTALYHGTLQEQGFEVRRMQRKPNVEKQRVRALQRTLYDVKWDSIRQVKVAVLADSNTYTPDSLAYFERILQEEDEFVTVFPDLLTEDSLITECSDARKKMAFEGYLYIRHTRLLEHPDYLRDSNESRKRGMQTSMLLLQDTPFIWIEPNGNYFPPQSLYTAWYWAWCDKIADLLPLDYDPSLPH